MSIELFKKTELGNFESILVQVEHLQSHLDAGYLLSPEDEKEGQTTDAPKKRGRKPKTLEQVELDAADEG